MSETCDVCGGCATWFCMGCNRKRCHCETEEGRRLFWGKALPVLADNLRWGAALSKAFDLGGSRGRWVSDYFEGWYDENEEGPWSEGCGRPAP